MKNHQICGRNNKLILKTPKCLHQSFYKNFYLAILGKKIVAEDLWKLPKLQQIATSGHTVNRSNLFLVTFSLVSYLIFYAGKIQLWVRPALY